MYMQSCYSTEIRDLLPPLTPQI
uniref:Uncharacterized protein n=1 Tax=Arundo donax TaxID=35708 RepID=A0A0A9H8D5_ARUDO